MEIVPVEPPGIRFSQLVMAASSQGVSKPAVWRHLERFCKIGAVIHDDRFYRRNPLYKNPILETLETLGIDLTLYRDTSAKAADFWKQKAPYFWVTGKQPSEDLKTLPARSAAALEEGFPELLAITIDFMIDRYLSLLKAIIACPDLATAREVASLMASVDWIPMMLARQVWDNRKRFRLNSLEGEELKFTFYRSEKGLSVKPELG